MSRGKKINYIGLKSGRLTVIGEAKKSEKDYHVRVICKCECGNKIVVRGTSILNKRVGSCGCVALEKNASRLTKHGMYGTRLNRIWNGIKRRCLDENDKQFFRYGGRGIAICEEWKNDFMAFYDWAMANGYKDNLTIDRIDNNGNYEPSNCRWADKKTQSRNTRKNKRLYYNGTVYCLTEWAERFGIHPETLRSRLRRGLSIKEALEYNKGDKNVQDTKEKSN